jgi:hypothetical protein
VGIGSSTPNEKLVVNGAVVLGNNVNNLAGTMRWSGSDFEGFNGIGWVSLTNNILTTTPEVIVIKPSTETVNNSAALQDDDNLFFNIGANETWTFRVTVYGNSGTTPDFKFALTAPSGASCDYAGVDIEAGASTPDVTTCGVATAVLAGNTAVDVYELVGTVANGATPGQVKFQWAQNTATASNSTVAANSILIAKRSVGSSGLAQAFIQGGNSLATTSVFGSNDPYNLSIIANGIERINVATSGIVSINGGLTLSGLFRDSTNAAGTQGMVLLSTGTSTLWVATSSLGISSGSTFSTTSINGLATTTFAFATGTTGTDFNIATSTTGVTFNIPDASASNRGLVTIIAQSFAGLKTFLNGIVTTTLTATGQSNLANASTSNITTSNLFATSSLFVTGTSTLATTTATRLTVSGQTTLGTASSSALTVTGQTVLSTASATALTTSGAVVVGTTLGVTGTSTLATTTISSLTSATGTITNLNTTNASATSFFASNGSSTNFRITNATATNFFATNASTTNATSSNFFSNLFTAITGFFTNLTATNATTSNLVAGTFTATSTTSLATTTITKGTINDLTSASGTITTLNSTTGNFTTLNASSSVFTSATTTNFFASNGSSTNFRITNGTTTNLTLLGVFRDSTNASGTLGQILWSTGTSTRWVATSSLGLSASLTGGVSGFATRWVTSTTLGTSTLIDNGTVLGINATSSSFTFNVQGSAGVNPFNVASSTGTSLFTILQNGNVGIGSSTPSRTLTVAGSLGLTGAFFDSTNASGTQGMVLLSTGTSTRWVATSSLGISGGGSLSGGTDGFLTRWTSSNTVSSGISMDNGTVAGINATTSTSTFNIQGTAGLNPLTVSSSTGATLLSVVNSGNLLIGTTSEFSLAKIQIDGSTASNGATTAVTGIYVNGLFNPTAGGVQVGNRSTFTNAPTSVANTAVGQIVRMTDNSALANTVRGLEVVSSVGTNTLGTNTGIRSTGATFGIQAYTTGLAGGVTAPAALYGENLGTTQGDALRLYSASVTSASAMATIYQETSSFSGTGLLMNLGAGTGAFTGNFVDLKKNGVSQFTIGNNGSIGTLGSISASGTLLVTGQSTFSSASTTNLLASTATTTDLTILGKLFDSTNATGTLGQILWSTGTSTRWVATSSLGLSASLTGGVSGFATRWVTSTTLGTSTLIDNGTVLGINATSSTVAFNVRGVAGSTNTIFNVASSSNASFFSVGSNGRVGIGSTTPVSTLSITSLSGTNPFTIASSTGAVMFNFGSNGRLGIGSTSPAFTLGVNGTLGVTGQTTLSTASATALTVSGKTTLANASSTALTVSGNSVLATTTISSLTVSSGTITNFNTVNATATTFFASNGSSTNFRITNATATNLTLLGAFRDSTNASGTVGQILWSTGTSTRWVATSSLGISSSLTGGVAGFATRWVTSTTLGTSTLLDNGTVAGINATSSLFSFNVQGKSGINPFNVSSSLAANLFTILDNGNVGVGTTTPASKFTVNGDIRLAQGSGGQIIFADGSTMSTAGLGSSSGISTLTDAIMTADSDANGSGDVILKIGSVDRFHILNNGNIGIGSSTPFATLAITGTAGVNPFVVASSTGLPLFTIGSNGVITSGTSSTALTVASGKIDADAITLASTTSATTATSSGSGLAVYADGLSMLRGCSTGQVLRWNATTAAWECNKGTDAVHIVKSTNQATTTTTLQDDNALTFSVNAGETWVYKFDLINTNTNSATPDWKAAIKGATGWTCRAIQSGSEGAGTVFPQSSTTNCTGTPTALTNTAVSADVNLGFNVTIQGWITTTTAGPVKLQWAANTAGLVTVLAGSRVTAQKVGGVDVAEMYYTTDTDMNPGDVVSLDSSISAGVKKSSTPYDKTAIGIVSTKPGLVLGDGSANTTDTPVMIALSGRVPVKVSTENGPIVSGDYLTSSSIAGVAMKATRSGQIIGQAMTDYNGTGVGAVLTFIKTSVSNGSTVADLLVTEQATSTSETSLAKKTLIHFIAKTEQLIQSLNLSEIITDRLSAALEVITPKILTGEVATNKITSAIGSDIKVELENDGVFTIGSSSSTVQNSIIFDALGNGSFAETLTAGNLNVSQDMSVLGNASFTESVTVQNDVTALGNIFTSGAFTVGTASQSVLTADTLNSKVSIGTSTGSATFLVQGTSSRDIVNVVSAEGSSLFSIVADGSVGIGTSSPSSSLFVQGKEGQSPFAIASSTGSSIFTVNENGFIGVGTSTALAMFDVWGSLRVGTGTMATFIVNTDTNVVGIGNDGTQVGDEMLRVSGRVRATGFDIDGAADLAENFEAVEAVDAGTVVAFSTTTTQWSVGSASSTDDTYLMSTVRKAVDAHEAVGVISTNAGIVLGKNIRNGVPVAFSGRIPVKVTTENGEIKRGDYITVSKTMAGYAMKLTGEGKSIGRALSDYTVGRDKVLMLVESGVEKLDIEGKNATTTGMLTTGNIDLNANGVAITNIKSLASASGTWSIDENGRITAKVLCLEDVCIDKSTLTNMLQVAGQASAVLGASTTTVPTTSTTIGTSTTQGTDTTASSTQPTTGGVPDTTIPVTDASSTPTTPDVTPTPTEPVVDPVTPSAPTEPTTPPVPVVDTTPAPIPEPVTPPPTESLLPPESPAPTEPVTPPADPPTTP